MVKLRSSDTRNVHQYRTVHINDEKYGRSSERFLHLLLECVRSGRKKDNTWHVQSVLDFGCGKSSLVDRAASDLGAKAYKYDPAIPDYSKLEINQADLIINTDVLEHLDEEEADFLLADIGDISKMVFFNIATRPAGKSLPNGENAHANVRPDTWWRNKLKSHFSVVTHLPSEPGKATFVTWKITQTTRLRIYIVWLVRHSPIRKRFSSLIRLLKRLR